MRMPLALLVALGVVLSCGRPAPTSIDTRTSGPAVDRLKPVASLDGDDSSGDTDDTFAVDSTGDNPDPLDSLVTCDADRYDSVTQTVGPAGGEIAIGKHWLVVPQGALLGPVSITAVAPSDTVVLLQFQPEGLLFLKPAHLVATYDNCQVPGTVTPRVAQVTDALDVIALLAAGDSSAVSSKLRKRLKGHRYVIGELPHFSNYAVAW